MGASEMSATGCSLARCRAVARSGVAPVLLARHYPASSVLATPPVEAPTSPSCSSIPRSRWRSTGVRRGPPAGGLPHRDRAGITDRHLSAAVEQHRGHHRGHGGGAAFHSRGRLGSGQRTGPGILRVALESCSRGARCPALSFLIGAAVPLHHHARNALSHPARTARSGGRWCRRAGATASRKEVSSSLAGGYRSDAGAALGWLPERRLLGRVELAVGASLLFAVNLAAWRLSGR